MKAVCFGSLNIDYTYRVDHFVQKGETLQSDGLKEYCGGKGLNQSIALAKAGAEVFHAGAVGTDGKMLLEALKNAGVHTELVDVLEDVRTGHAIIQNDTEGDNCILLHGGANMAISREQADRVFASCCPGDYLILQNEISQMPYIVKKAYELGMKIILNPSPMNEAIFQLPLECIDCFILNEIEAKQLLNTEDCLTPEKTAGIFRERFPNASMVLTLGAQGSVYVSGEEFYEQKAYKVEAKDTTAAGDTFTGFFLGGVMAGQTVPEALEQAAKASAIAVTRYGASPSIPRLEEIAGYFTLSS